MIKKVALAITAAAVIAGGAVAAPAAQASIQPSCWGRAVKCLAATPAAPPDVHYHAPPNLKYQADQADPPPSVHYHT
jgi:hypothetical protein